MKQDRTDIRRRQHNRGHVPLDMKDMHVCVERDRKQAVVVGDMDRSHNLPNVITANFLTGLDARDPHRAIGTTGGKPWCQPEVRGSLHEPGVLNGLQEHTPVVEDIYALVGRGGDCECV